MRKHFGAVAWTVMVYVFMSCGTSVAQKSTSDYLKSGKSVSKPILIKTFEETVSGAKKNDWKAIEKAVGTVKSKVVSLDKAFGTVIMGDLDKAVIARDAGKMLNSLANAIYLALLDELKLAAADKFKFADKSLEHIEEAKQLYVQVLSVNVARKDPALDKSILAAFDEAAGSVENADEALYDNAVSDIAATMLKVYVKFQQKKSGVGLRTATYC